MIVPFLVMLSCMEWLCAAFWPALPATVLPLSPSDASRARKAPNASESPSVALARNQSAHARRWYLSYISWRSFKYCLLMLWISSFMVLLIVAYMIFLPSPAPLTNLIAARLSRPLRLASSTRRFFRSIALAHSTARDRFPVCCSFLYLAYNSTVLARERIGCASYRRPLLICMSSSCDRCCSRF